MPKNTMAWAYRKNARHRNPKKDDVRKAVCNKTKRKTKNEMAGSRVHGPEKDGYKRMERQSKEPRGLEAYFSGGQGPSRAVAPSGGGGGGVVHLVGFIIVVPYLLMMADLPSSYEM